MAITNAINWTSLGRDLRQSARDAHGDEIPSVHFAYDFLLANPECFIDDEEWPAEMPSEPGIELIAAYYDSAYDVQEASNV